MARQRELRTAVGHIPDLDRLVVAGCGQGFAVRRISHREHRFGMAFGIEEFHTRMGVPNLDGAVSSASCQFLPFRVEGQGANAGLFEDMNLFFATSHPR